MPVKPSIASLTMPLGWFGHNRTVITHVEVAAKLLVSDEQVRKYVERGWLLVMPVGAATEGAREHLRIMRYTVDAYLSEIFFERNGREAPFTIDEQARLWRLALRKLRGVLPLTAEERAVVALNFPDLR